MRGAPLPGPDQADAASSPFAKPELTGPFFQTADSCLHAPPHTPQVNVLPRLIYPADEEFAFPLNNPIQGPVFPGK